MIDRRANALLRPALTLAARGLAACRIRADQVTWAGFAIGLTAAAVIALGQPLAGLGLILLSRLLDGLDGAVARLTAPTDRGGFLDITLDFLFYASIPLAFALNDPVANALPAAVLLFAFAGTGSSFLAYAALAAKRNLRDLAWPDKSFYYLGGLTEAGETLLCFTLMCLWPGLFSLWAYGFAALCLLTTGLRIHAGWTAFAPEKAGKDQTPPHTPDPNP